MKDKKFNADKAYVVRSAAMETFLEETMRYVEQEHHLGYRFLWDLIPCYGKVTVTPHHLHLDIYPCDIKDNIGNGCGMMVSKMFDRDN